MNIKHTSLKNEIWLNEFLIDIALFKKWRNMVWIGYMGI